MSGKTKEALTAEIAAAVAAGAPEILGRLAPSLEGSGTFTATVDTLHIMTAGGGNVTLPPLASVPTGEMIGFWSLATGTNTFTGDGAETVTTLAATANAVTLKLRGCVYYFVSGPGTWAVLGTPLMQAAAVGVNQTLATNTSGEPIAAVIADNSVVGRATASVTSIAVSANDFLGRNSSSPLQALPVNTNSWVGRNSLGSGLGGNQAGVNTWLGRKGSGTLRDNLPADNSILGKGTGDFADIAIADSQFVGRPVGGAVGAVTKAQALAILFPNTTYIDTGIITSAGTEVYPFTKAMGTDNTTLRWKFQVQAYQTAGTGFPTVANGLWDVVAMTTRDDSSTITIDNTTFLNGPFQSATAAAWTVALNISGTDLRIGVTGEASKTIKWRIFGTVQED